MGLVNLRNAKLLLLSVTSARLGELKNISVKLGFKNVQTVDSIPGAIAALKAGRTDVLIVDADLGGTSLADFLKAMHAGFPKIKILSISDGGGAGGIHFPLDEKAYGKAVDQLVMEKMGIAPAAVAFSEDE